MKNTNKSLNDSKPFRDVFRDCSKEFYRDKGENRTVSLWLSLYIAIWGPQEKREFSLSVAL